MNENLTPSTIKFFQSKPGKKPIRAHATDAGIDFFVPTFTSIFIKDLINKNEFLLERDGYNNSSNVTYNGVIGHSALTGMSGTNGNCGCMGTRIDTVEKQIPENLNIVKFDAKLGLSYFELYRSWRGRWMGRGKGFDNSRYQGVEEF